MLAKKFLLPVVLVNMALASGVNIASVSAGPSDPISRIYGNWTLNYNFSCSGGSTSTPMVFNNNGTFSLPAQSLTGTWAFSGDTIRFTFSGGNTSYVGNAYSFSMKGRSAASNGSFYGCWTATKNGVPQVAKEVYIPADGSP